MDNLTFDKGFRKSFVWFIGIALLICCLPWLLAKHSWIDFSTTGEIQTAGTVFEKRPLDIPKGGAYSDGLKKVDDVFQDDFDMEAQIYMEWKMYDHLVKFCLHTS